MITRRGGIRRIRYEYTSYVYLVNTDITIKSRVYSLAGMGARRGKQFSPDCVARSRGDIVIAAIKPGWPTVTRGEGTRKRISNRFESCVSSRWPASVPRISILRREGKDGVVVVVVGVVGSRYVAREAGCLAVQQ